MSSSTNGGRCVGCDCAPATSQPSCSKLWPTRSQTENTPLLSQAKAPTYHDAVPIEATTHKCEKNNLGRRGVCCRELKGEDERTLINPDVVRDIIIGLSDGLTVSTSASLLLLLVPFATSALRPSTNSPCSLVGPFRFDRRSLCCRYFTHRRNRWTRRARFGRHLHGNRWLPSLQSRAGPLPVPSPHDARSRRPLLCRRNGTRSARNPRALRRRS